MTFAALARRLPAAPATALDRRSFVKLTGTGAFALAFAPAFSPAFAQNAAPATGPKPNEVPGPFVAIAPDGSVTVQVNRLDFGQGAATALPMLVAEEMDADWTKVKGELAPAIAVFADPVFGIQMTGGSLSFI